MVNLKFQLTTGNHLQHIGRSPFQFFACGGVVSECRSRDEQRAFLRELDQVERRHRAARSAKQNQITTRAEYIQILSNVALPTPSKTTSTPRPSVNVASPFSKSVCVYTMHSSAPAARARSRLLFIAGSGDDTRAETLAHLHEQLAHASRGCMNQGCFTCFQRIGAATKIMRGNALQHRRRYMTRNPVPQEHSRGDRRERRHIRHSCRVFRSTRRDHPP